MGLGIINFFFFTKMKSDKCVGFQRSRTIYIISRNTNSYLFFLYISYGLFSEINAFIDEMIIERLIEKRKIVYNKYRNGNGDDLFSTIANIRRVY